MKKIICFSMIIFLSGCVSMRYTDGNKLVEYTSIGRTAQTIEGDLQQGTVKVGGQKIDAKVIELINNIIKATGAL